jgi:hypothetical protein
MALGCMLDGERNYCFAFKRFKYSATPKVENFGRMRNIPYADAVGGTIAEAG